MYCEKCDWHCNDETCPKCGDKLVGEIEVNICPICNEPNDENEKFCKKCKCFLDPNNSKYDDCSVESDEEYVEEVYVIKDGTPILCYIIAGVNIFVGVISLFFLPYIKSIPQTFSFIFSIMFSGIFFLAMGRIVNYLKRICNKLNTINFIAPNKDE